MSSILESIRKASGVSPDDTDFDIDLIPLTNTVISIVAQLGFRTQGDFVIESDAETWEDYFGDNLNRLQLIKTYIGMKVRMMWDPPQSSITRDAMEESLKELESRIIYTLESKGE